jgi:rhomboid protease GluP
MHVMMKIMLVTAITSSAAHVVLGASHTLQLGASGIVFMQILLSSLIEVKHGRVPLTFLVQVMLWCYKEVTLLLLGPSDGVSHKAHISGAICGVAAGYAHVDTTEYKKREEIMQSMSVVGDLPTPYNVFASQKNS